MLLCISDLCQHRVLFLWTHMVNKFSLFKRRIEFHSQRSNEMTRNWPSGHMGLILYHHPHGNWLCIVLPWIISESYWECMSHKSAQSFKVYSSGRQQWFHRDLRCAWFQVKRLKCSISIQKWTSASSEVPDGPILIKSCNGFDHTEKCCINFLFGNEN